MLITRLRIEKQNTHKFYLKKMYNYYEIKMRERKMKISKKKGLFAFVAIVLLLTIAVTFGCNSELSYELTPRAEGAYDVYKIVAKFIGDAPPSTPTAINCSVSHSSITLGDNLTVSGFISPAVSGVAVTLTYKKPDATTLTRTVTSGIDGAFRDYYTPSVVGGWSVKASWLGNVNYLGATSFAAEFTVNNPGTIPMEYVYAVAAIVIIVIVAIALYWFTKKK